MPLNMDQDTKTNGSREHAFEKFSIDRPGKIIFVGHHLSTKTSFRCLIRSISLHGAELEVSPHLPVPNNFFLEILGIHDDIGCTVIRREEEKVTVGFNMLIDAEFLHHVIRLNFETSH
ncbi:PilZ domain-containing protein [Neorhizobium galegae]|uniref:PilZ domain-containing protein n=2 Tax=Neorhizobium galegae TaxID=399 RepID=A0A068SMY0_NEOGA|nr:PilZ domain-containing protein [Neorhizobium galegae]KAB1085846.1 hypothetical protein F4V91_05000 [Neorhizobium galegae]MCQ1850092.1 PilZ domain-containing protein [Neorhizobium galegae]CDN47136.1 Hypothetical protein RG540_CH09470 [Neorhizobium galegae bv. orientalis str. HAMBI 540]CDZ48181.1 Hypothetical protein NGAL_HAMBI2427_25550 [Neorhizobium galegae bv. orientalis]